MAGPRFLVALIAIQLHVSFNSAARNLLTVPETNEFIRRSCSSTTYPRLCYSSLSADADAIETSLKGDPVGGQIHKPHDGEALPGGQGMTPREVGALKDCVEELGDSVDEIGRSIDEKASTRQPNFRFMISDMKTWVSAALTDENTCSDGFAGEMMNGKLKTAVGGRIVKIAQLTSNALALINLYATVTG